MTGCHNCGHAAAIAAGKYAERDWEDVPCSTCDVMRGAEQPFEVIDCLANACAALPEENPPETETLPVWLLKEFITGFLMLPPELRDVVAWRFAGRSYVEIARLQAVTPEAVEKRHRRALKLWPVLFELFPQKAARWGSRSTESLPGMPSSCEMEPPAINRKG